MKTRIVILGLAGVFLILNSPVLAVERLVPSQYSTIQAAIDDCNNGDVVIAEPNTYTGPGNKDIDFKGLAITVRGTDPNDPAVVAATVIDCKNAAQDRGFYFHNGEGPNSIVSGFTIKRGYVYNMKGGGICCSGSSPTIKNCTITNNKAQGSDYAGSYIGHSYGGGISCTSSSHPTIINCTISDNTTSGGDGSFMRDGGNAYGGGIYSDSDSNLTIINCVITNNTARGGNGGEGGSGGNGCGAGVYCGTGSAATISNCTIVDNIAHKGVAGLFGPSDGISRGGGVYGSAGVENCIVWANTAISSPQIYGAPVVSYSDVEDGFSGEGNIDADPCFIDPAGGDYHLLFDSPCVGAGDPNYEPVPGETDIDGDNRIIDGRIDIGADEFNPEMPFLEISPAAFEFEALENGPNPAPQILFVSNSQGGVLTWVVTEDCNWLEVYPDNGQCTDEVNEVTLNVDISGIAAGFYNCELTINAGGALNSPQTATATLRVYDEDGVLKVPSEYGTIQAAIDAAQPGDMVIVAEGTYTGAGNKNLDYGGKAITVQSIDPEDPCVVADTVIDCENSGRGFYFHSAEEANSILAGFTIKRGKATGRPAKGGAIYCSGASPTIKNCVITSNQAGGSSGSSDGGNAYGGGVYCESNSSLTLIDCTVSSNRAAGGIGGSRWCSPLSGCFGEIGDGGVGYGGGIFGSSDSGLTIIDCIISVNSASGGKGGVYYETGYPIAGASGGRARGGGIYSGSAATVINNCGIFSNTARGGDTGLYLGGGGGGAALGGGVYYDAGAEITNCTVISNMAIKGSGEYMEDSGGGGIRGTAATTITNCILWGNDDDLYGCSATYSCIEDGNGGEGNIDAEPLFVTGPFGDYYLSQIAAGQAVDSPCVDAGSDTAANLGMDMYTTRTDEIGDGGIVDMGYHYSAPIAADINRDLKVDLKDLAILGSQWRQEPHVPSADIAPPGGDGKVDEKDLALLVANWLWEKQQ